MMDQGNIFQKEAKELCHKTRNDQIGASLVTEILHNSKIICQ